MHGITKEWNDMKPEKIIDLNVVLFTCKLIGDYSIVLRKGHSQHFWEL